MRRRLIIIAVLAVATPGCRSDRPGDAAAGAEGQATTTFQLDPEQVPELLRPMVPLAPFWGIGDDVDRADIIARASAADRETLQQAIAPHQSRITAWLDSFGTDPMSDEAAAFMYLQLAVEEMRGN
jgi:hypothetical protein